MRKLFRFKYEPCSGMCYTWCDKLTTELLKLSPEYRKGVVKTMVDAHNRLCDNPDYSFGIDTDKTGSVFVGHFRTPNKTDLFYSTTFVDTLEQVTKAVFAEDIPKVSGGVRLR